MKQYIKNKPTEQSKNCFYYVKCSLLDFLLPSSVAILLLPMNNFTETYKYRHSNKETKRNGFLPFLQGKNGSNLNQD